jgi:hypothetical protein
MVYHGRDVSDQGDWGARGRCHWTVTAFGETDPAAAGRTGELGKARSQAEGALLAYVEGGDGQSDGRTGGNG